MQNNIKFSRNFGVKYPKFISFILLSKTQLTFEKWFKINDSIALSNLLRYSAFFKDLFYYMKSQGFHYSKYIYLV